MKVDALYLAKTVISSKYQIIEGMIGIVKPFKTIFGSASTARLSKKGLSLASFCPETALFRNFCVNLQVCLCGEQMFASAEPFDFLELAKNTSFPHQKLY
jgi:hypothetical protein